MELVYLWVEDYKNIHKQGFNFSPRFNCEYDEINNKLTIDENEDYVNIFPENINITAIVGKNGSGKSNLLEYITKQNFNIALFFKNNILYINSNIEIDNTTKYDIEIISRASNFKLYNKLIYLQTFIDVNKFDIRGFAPIPRTFFQLRNKISILQEIHQLEVKLYNTFRINNNQNNIEIPILSYFQALKNEYLNKIIQNYIDLYPFLNKYFKIQKINYDIRNLGDIFHASPSFKDYYKTNNFLKEMYTIYDDSNNIDKLKILFFIFIYIRNTSVNSKLNIDFNELNKNNYREVFDKIISIDDEEYVSKWKKFIDIYTDNPNLEDLINAYFEVYDLIKHDILIFNFFPELSSGEEKILYVIVNIFHSLSKSVFSIPNFEKYILLILDEPDIFLHPNWQKKFLYLIMNFLTKMFPQKIFHIVFTTHSPFLLSDLPKKNIIFLDTNKDKKCKVLNQNEILNKKQTFGTNIHTLLSDSFFMENGLMGEFAKSKIRTIKVAHRYILHRHERKTLFKQSSKRCRRLLIKQLPKFWQIQEIIGEPFLQKIVKNQLEEIELILLGKDKAIDNEIARLQALKESLR